MTVGESLTQARHQAGLSVDELSERTRIRGAVIASIERDQYDACGGDIYVRGYVRAIAGAVGIDAQPLIHEYDQVREIPGADGAEADLAATRFDLKPFPGDLGFGDNPPYVSDPPYLGRTDFAGDPDATRFDLPAITDDPPAEDLMAAGYELSPARITEPVPLALPSRPARPARTARGGGGGGGGGLARGDGGTADGRTRKHRGRGVLIGVAALVALVVVGVIGVRLASSGSSSRNTAATGVPLTATPSAAAGKATAGRASATPATSTRPATSARRTRPAPVRPVRALPIAAAQAFGPDGLADGDNPSTARDAITADASLPWSTQWYATPEFGALKPGTGLLLDLGRPVTITSLRLDLAAYPGANLQIRVGDSASPGDLLVAATVTDTGGALKLTLRHPQSARYLLVWFTQLPPNGAGHYEESVSHVAVNGRRS